ncbi:MAG: class I SAM-dependent methyltransferase, partial [Pseudomonadota bacterium]
MPWFEDWFNSPYYSLLYNNRNSDEANLFIHNILAYLNPKPKAHIADIPCGNGRHAVALAKAGFEVIGFDLAERNIAEAKLSEKENLTFYQHDMRQPFH